MMRLKSPLATGTLSAEYDADSLERGGTRQRARTPAPSQTVLYRGQIFYHFFCALVTAFQRVPLRCPAAVQSVVPGATQRRRCWVPTRIRLFPVLLVDPRWVSPGFAIHPPLFTSGTIQEEGGPDRISILSHSSSSPSFFSPIFSSSMCAR